ncbi:MULTISPECIES: Hachiman antiphage defense system protein HamA [Serratia]|uniref:Hachiman antiphage defense system protein HamA n=1 Tax=Serratia TaxID=613 RepID=UPI001AA0E67C|nr:MULTISPECIES: Hachiman antiphage defense system protein HamA [Serratia]CAF2653804.1 hypothetical protein AI2887V1_0075 [Serratia marcescens]CAH5022067.1 hypothetical protein AI2887V1_0075 [Serratia marcescens]SMP74948.1 protein of unknown function [Serratia sp. CC22-02]
MEDIDKLKGIDWSELIVANHGWIEKHLHVHPINSEKKITARFYSVPYAGLHQEVLTLAGRIADSIEHYVFDEASLAEMRKEGIIPFRKAAEFFGDTNPIVDGKYGELILYALSEFVLRTPMVTHKITSLTNVNDQVKGGDGIFFGDYGGRLSILIGESKIYSDFSQALESAFDSLNRFNEAYSGSALSHEMFIARSNISKNFDIDTLDLIYKAFTPGTELYNECVKTHPVLIIFQDEYLEKIQVDSMTKSDAEALFSAWLETKRNEICQIISSKYKRYPKMASYILDFFLIPMTDVSHFKKTLYKAIHAIEFKEPVKKNKTKRVVKTTGTKKKN